MSHSIKPKEDMTKVPSSRCQPLLRDKGRQLRTGYTLRAETRKDEMSTRAPTFISSNLPKKTVMGPSAEQWPNGVSYNGGGFHEAICLVGGR